MKKGINVYLDSELEKRISAAAKEKGLSMSAWIRLLIADELGEQKESSTCPNCGIGVDEEDEFGQKQFHKFPNGVWRCTSCGGEGRWQ